MSRSFIRLRRALLGTSCAIVFGLGGAELLAAPAAPVPAAACDATQCYHQCISNGIRTGRCISGRCVCGV